MVYMGKESKKEEMEIYIYIYIYIIYIYIYDSLCCTPYTTLSVNYTPKTFFKSAHVIIFHSSLGIRVGAD